MGYFFGLAAMAALLVGYNISTVVEHEPEGWEQAVLSANFVQSRMVDDVLREYTRVDRNGRVYELFVTYNNPNSPFLGGYETWLFVSEVVDGIYRYIDSFEIYYRQGNATGGIIFADIDFDGQHDVLVWLGHFGAQGTVAFDGFVRRGDTYARTNFTDIPNPELDMENMRVRGTIRNHGASHSWFIYAFADGTFKRTDEITFETCTETFEFMHIITLRDGEEVNEIHRGEVAQRLFDTKFLEGNEFWGFGGLGSFERILTPHEAAREEW